MPDSTLSDNRPGDSETSAVETLGHLHEPTLNSGLGEERRSGQPESNEALRSQLDLVHVQLLTAVDAVAGAEAERSAAEARIRELEHQHHMLEVERDQLHQELERLGDSRRPMTRRVFGRLRSLARRAILGRR